eukprot:767361-Hanusia_phi.AAC.1
MKAKERREEKGGEDKGVERKAGGLSGSCCREEDGDRDGAIVWSSLEMRSKSIVVVSSFSVRVYCALNGSFLRRF